MNDDVFADFRSVGYIDTHMADISLAIAVATFTNVFNRINDTPIDVTAFVQVTPLQRLR